MAHDARAVANALIEKALAEDKSLTPLQIIKLVYFCHGWMLGLYRKPLIEQEVQAWTYGPVIADVYHGLKEYGGDAVPRPMNAAPANFDEVEKDLINQVYEKYGRLSGVDLSRLTHAPGTPWSKVWNKKGQNAPISNALLQKYYGNRA